MVTRPPLDPQRVEAFAHAYAPAILQALRELKSWTGELSPEEYAAVMTVEMVKAVERCGIECIKHYYLNSYGGALRYTATALGVEVDTLQLYLRGDK